MKPTDQQIREAFHKTADAIVGDYYQLWDEAEDNGEDFELGRDHVADYLNIHGGEHGLAVYEWCLNLTPEDFIKEMDAAKVPTHWTE